MCGRTLYSPPCTPVSSTSYALVIAFGCNFGRGSLGGEINLSGCVGNNIPESCFRVSPVSRVPENTVERQMCVRKKSQHGAANKKERT